MNAKKCDRCGKFYEHYSGEKKFSNGEQSNAILFINRGDGEKGYFSHYIYDLCPECMEELQKWLKGEKTDGQ